MATSSYTIAANDEHGQNPPTEGKRTPVMPYLNVRIYENQFNRPTKNRFLEACLRCGYNVYDVKPEITDASISTRVARVNRRRPTILVTFGYNAFGSGNNFNSARGITTFYSSRNPYAAQSRALAEDLYEQLVMGTSQLGRGVENLIDVGVLGSVNCRSVLVEPGFMTNLSEAKLMIDPDYRIEVAEECCKGICAYLGENYIGRDVLADYPTLKTGSRGNFVRLLQFILNEYGYGLTVDGVFGSGTASAVRRFQQANGLTADGVVGRNTWRSLLVLPPRPTLRRGDRNVYVTYLQQKLTSKLYPLGTPDGVFGAKTQNAVIEFQSENGLTADGIVGANTWARVARIGGGRS